MKKKILAAAILVLVFAGSAMAAPGYGNAGRCGPGAGMPMGYGQQIWQNAAPEVRAKMDERAKLNIDLRAELQKDIPNKAKARDIHEKIQKLNREIETAHFEEILKDPSKFKAQARGPRREFSPEDRAQMEEIRKLHAEIRTELQKEAPNKAKIRDLHTKIQKIKSDRDNARLEEMLKNPEAFKNSRGFGRGFRNNPAQQ
jgi:Spy/CpxP family protein refolding chaperone